MTQSKPQLLSNIVWTLTQLIEINNHSKAINLEGFKVQLQLVKIWQSFSEQHLVCVEKVGKWLPNSSTKELLYGVEKVGKWLPDIFSVVSKEELLFGVEKVGKWIPNALSVISMDELLFGVEKVGKWHLIYFQL